MKDLEIDGKKNWKRVALAGVMLFGALALVSLTPVVKTLAGTQQYPIVVPSDAVVYGRTFAEWSAAWWQWAFSLPVASHPLFDNADCSVGQSGPVWFLGGKFCQSGPNAPPCTPGVAVRSCAVPGDKAIYVPISNIEDSAPEEPNYGCGSSLSPLIVGTIAELRKCAETYATPSSSMSVELDGRTIPNLENYHVRSVAFGFTLPDDNLLKAIGENIPAGTYFPSTDDGVYLMLTGLAPGNHYLHLRAGSSQDITYHLLVSK